MEQGSWGASCYPYDFGSRINVFAPHRINYIALRHGDVWNCDFWENKLLKKMEAYYEKNKNNPTKRTNFMANLEAMQKELERRNEELKKNNKQ